MFLRSVKLRDWRSYRQARFEFPVPQCNKNVILIRAPNESGKTSFFEAVVLGLFGRDGLLLVPRARIATSTGDLSDRQAISYSQFLEGALNWQAINQGRQSCAVTLEFEDDDGEQIELSRKWHFSLSGQHKPHDEELHIYQGDARRPLSPPATVSDRGGWYRDYITETFLPWSLAEFFLFDGEQVQRYASRGMSGQIQLGIEGLLGLPVLRSLKDSLQRYAQNRRSSSASPSDEKVKEVETEIQRLESEIATLRQKCDDVDKLLPSLEAEQDEIISQIGGSGEGTVAMVADLMQEEERFRTDADRAIEELLKLLATEVSLAVAGKELRSQTIEALRSEEVREAWESGRNQGNANLDRFLDDLSGRLERLPKPITGDKSVEVVCLAREAWEALWHPAPDGCSESYLHTGLMGASRAQAIDRLDEVGRRSAAELEALVQRWHASKETMTAKKNKRLSLEQRAPEIDRLTKRLKKLNSDIAEMRQRRTDSRRYEESAEGDLAAKRQELGRYVESQGRGAPALRRASQAVAVAGLIEDVLEQAVPTQVTNVAEAMTRAWKGMAQMSDRVDRIEITPECKVRLLNKRGEDIHEIEKSAGASQIFTQSLIWAITHVSGERFPFIVDTPLARLSRDHRIGVLKTFLDREGQVILLSTDEEVVGDKLDSIRHRVAVCYQLQVKMEHGVAVTSVVREEI